MLCFLYVASLKHFSDAPTRVNKQHCLFDLRWVPTGAVQGHVTPVLPVRLAEGAGLESDFVVCPARVRYEKRVTLPVAEIVLYHSRPAVRLGNLLPERYGPAPVFLDLAGASNKVFRTVRLYDVPASAVLELPAFRQVVPSGLQDQPVLPASAPVWFVLFRLTSPAHQVPV